MDSFAYTVDGENRLTAVSSNWDDFLRANEGLPTSASAAVIGRSLFDFISGPETIHLYHLLLQNVRSTGKTATVLFNCDSPALRRRLRLSMIRGIAGGVVFRSTVLSIVAREPVELLETGASAGEVVTICSFCKKLALPENRWVEPEAFLRETAYFTMARPPRLTHGVCPACYSAAVDEVSRLGDP
jgi:hypothetical protein